MAKWCLMTLFQLLDKVPEYMSRHSYQALSVLLRKINVTRTILKSHLEERTKKHGEN